MDRHLKATMLLKQHGWKLLRNLYEDGTSRFEIWCKPKRGTMIVQFWEEGSVTTYFEGGGMTWESLEIELTK